MRKPLALLSMLLLTSWGTAGVIFSENFDGQVAEDVATGLLGTTAFEVTAGNVDLVAPPNPYTALCGPSDSCVDTTGSTAYGARGTITTIDTIHFAPGIYYLSFSLQGWSYETPSGGILNNTATIRVTLPGFVDETLVRSGGSNPYPIVRIVFTVETEQNLKLSFQDLSGSAGYAGAVLDDIEIGTTVPEPATMAIVLPMLAGLFWASRQRRNIRH